MLLNPGLRMWRSSNGISSSVRRDTLFRARRRALIHSSKFSRYIERHRITTNSARLYVISDKSSRLHVYHFSCNVTSNLFWFSEPINSLNGLASEWQCSFFSNLCVASVRQNITYRLTFFTHSCVRWLNQQRHVPTTTKSGQVCLVVSIAAEFQHASENHHASCGCLSSTASTHKRRRCAATCRSRAGGSRRTVAQTTETIEHNESATQPARQHIFFQHQQTVRRANNSVNKIFMCHVHFITAVFVAVYITTQHLHHHQHCRRWCQTKELCWRRR